MIIFSKRETPNGISDLKQLNELSDLHAILTIREKSIEKLEAEISQLTAANHSLKEQVADLVVERLDSRPLHESPPVLVGTDRPAG